MRSLTQRVAGQMGSLRNYRMVVGWVLRDAIWRFRGRVVGLVTLGGLGVFIQGAALAGALGYARALEGGGTVTVGQWEFAPRADVGLLTLVAGGISLALLVSGYFLYRFNSGVIALGRNYESVRIAETLRAATHLPHPHATEASGLLEEAHLARVQRDARLCGRVLRTGVQAFVPLLIVPAAGAALLVLNVWLTLLLAALTAVASLLLFGINRRGAQASERMERLARPAMQDRKEGVGSVLREDVAGATSPDIAETVYGQRVQGHLEAYAARLQAVEDSGLVSSAMTGLALGAILLIEGRAVLVGASSISALLAYLVLLRLFLTRFMALSRSVSAISRFYPQIKRHFSFAEAAKPAVREPPKGASFPAEISVPALHEEEGTEEGEARLERGQRLGLLVDGSLTRRALSGLSSAIRPLERTETSQGHVRVVRDTSQAGKSVREEVHFAPEVSREKILTELEHLGASKACLATVEGAGLHGAADPGSQDVLPDGDERFMVAFLATLSWQPHLLVVDAAKWRECSESARECLAGLARDTVLGFLSNSVEQLDSLNVDVTIQFERQEPVGWVPAAEIHRARKAATGRDGTSDVSGRAEDDDEDEQEDDELL